jgi:Chaperone of endosialidase
LDANAFPSPTTAGTVLQATGADTASWSALDLTDLPSSWVKQSVRVASAANVTGTLSGSVFTVTATGTLSLDGVVTALNDRVLLKDQTTAAQNGIYYVSTAGATGVSAVLTRAADANTAAELAGATVAVDLGTANAGRVYTNNFKSTDTLNTTAVNWYRVTDSSVTVAVGNGGTGTTTAPTPGGVVYGASSTAYGITAAGTSGQVLLSGAAGAPTWSSTPSLTSLTLSDGLTVDTNTLYVDSASNEVGIGTTSPTKKLDVVGTVKASSLELAALSAPGAPSISGGAGTGTTYYYTVQAYDSDGNTSGVSASFSSANTTGTLNWSAVTNASGYYVWRTTTNTSLAIGTSYPRASVSTNSASVATLVGALSSFAYPGVTSGTLQGITLTTQNLGYTTSGIQLRSAVAGASTSTDYFIQRGADNDIKNYIVAHVPNETGAGFAFMSTSGTHRLFVSGQNGNVGIGTNIPSYKLDVTGTARVTTDLTVGGNVGVTGNVNVVGGGVASVNYVYVGQDASHGTMLKYDGNQDVYYLNGYAAGVEKVLLKALNPAAHSESATLKLFAPGTAGEIQLVAGGQDGTDYVYVNNSGQFGYYSGAVQWYINAGTSGAIVTSSDIRFKSAIGPLDYSLEAIKSVNPISFVYTDDTSGTVQLGFSAQEVKGIIPEAVSEMGELPDGTQKLGMSYTALIPVLVNAVKELSAQVDELKAKMAAHGIE